MLRRLQQARSERRLHKALAEADGVRLLKRLKGGCDPNSRLQDTAGNPRSLLQLAIENGHPEPVRLLLDAGAAVDDPQLLHHAMGSGPQALRMLTLLLRAGADPNGDAGSAFFASLEQPDSATTQLLISRLMEHGGDVNCRDAQHGTPLRYALLAERQELSCLLISAGATLPDGLDQLPCSDELKALARRNARDLEVRRLLQET